MKLMQNLNARAKLVKAFRKGGIFLGTKERPIFPKINSVKVEEIYTEYVFSLPTGLDPTVVKKNEFVFKQVFGESIDLDGEVKKYVLTVFNKSMPSELIYNENEILKLTKKYRLGIIAGMDRNGQYHTFDLLSHPHILVAGETGSGKSTQLRSILTTLILNKKPTELELYLADCKKSEFHVFRNVEHVKCVLNKANDIKRMLKHIKKELDERSDLTETFEVGHVDDLPDEHKRPYIVVCIDEFVMLRKNEEIMDILIEISAIGRTLGVLAILSMQRPNAQTLDTTIRANCTVSMGFALRDKTEARIVNTPGAEKIDVLGRFIMNSNKIYELQAPYLTLKKAKELLSDFYVPKNAKSVFGREIQKDEPELKQLTESDVFDDVN